MDKLRLDHPNLYYRYELGAIAPTLQQLEDTVADALTQCNLGLCEDDIQALVQCDFKTWNAELEDMIGRAFPCLEGLKPTLKYLRGESQRFCKFDLDHPSNADQEFISRW